MTIRESGKTAFGECLRLYNTLLGIAANDISLRGQKAKILAQALALDVHRMKEAISGDDEPALVLALTGFPGTGRDFDGLDFRAEDYPALKEIFSSVSKKNLAFMEEVFPDLGEDEDIP